jgi:hypothetical protein
MAFFDLNPTFTPLKTTFWLSYGVVSRCFSVVSYCFVLFVAICGLFFVVCPLFMALFGR